MRGSLGQARLRAAMLAAADLACFAAVWAFAVWGYRASGLGHYKFGASFYLSLWPAALAFVVLNAAFRLYHGSVLYSAAPVPPVEEFRRLAVSSAMAHLGTVAYLALAYQTTENYSRAVIVISGLLVAVFAQTFRDAARALARRVGFAQIPVAVAGSGDIATRTVGALRRDSYTGFRPTLVFSADNLRDIVPVSRDAAVRILVACQDDRLLKAQMQDFSSWFTHIVYVPSGDSFPVYGAHTVAFDGICGLEMVNQRRMKALRAEKWLLDKALAVVAFALLLPVFAVVPLLVKLTSRGPVFYRQERLGRNGRRIRVWKFRSMYADADARLHRILETDPVRRAEWDKNFKLADDPRVTPLGRFLRKTSIDEFPQLFNVFAGDMALVGPRPIVDGEVARYGSAYKTFSSVEPGVTGLWQASGRSDTDYARRIALDAYYVRNWSPWLDLWILKKTVGAVLSMRGAC